ncbi:MAG: hypothetical protein DHS20C11_04400 [Lysobacteraceae bacterium]|nr:MAG: hypothetical protein DHS20C11_04400 [Xanthomonadaceae bacterium]
MKTLAFLLIVIFFAPTTSACDFDCTLKRHLDAIQSRDFAAFESTLTKSPRLTFILPDGRYWEDSAEYRQVLQGWFESEGWTLDYEILAIEKTEEMGHALLKVAYDEADRNGQPYHIDHYLALLFKKEGDGWYLVHDQNTLIQPPKGDEPD